MHRWTLYLIFTIKPDDLMIYSAISFLARGIDTYIRKDVTVLAGVFAFSDARAMEVF